MFQGQEHTLSKVPWVHSMELLQKIKRESSSSRSHKSKYQDQDLTTILGIKSSHEEVQVKVLFLERVLSVMTQVVLLKVSEKVLVQDHIFPGR